MPHLLGWQGGLFALTADDGREHIAAYPALRAEAATSYQRLCDEADAGRPDPNQVLLRLLPWADTQANRDRGAWVHIAPAIQGDIVRWFQGAGWTSPAMQFYLNNQASRAGAPNENYARELLELHTMGQAAYLS